MRDVPRARAVAPSVRLRRAAALDRDRTVDVSVVAHTHWDREWYEAFEGFRARLVDVVDEVLDVLDADSRFAAFHLDGYTALVDDYLEARPEAEDRVRRLVVVTVRVEEPPAGPGGEA